jgi:hypothetical protein
MSFPVPGKSGGFCESQIIGEGEIHRCYGTSRSGHLDRGRGIVALRCRHDARQSHGGRIGGGFLTSTLPAAKNRGIAVIGMKVLGGSHYLHPTLRFATGLLPGGCLKKTRARTGH